MKKELLHLEVNEQEGCQLSQVVSYSIKNKVGWLTLDRPDQLNAFTEEMRNEIQTFLKKAEADPHVRCIVITGNGKGFSAGQDLKDLDDRPDYGELLRKGYNPLIKQLSQLEKPIIAAINGVAAGAGMSLALACDFRVASEKASFIEAFIHIGLVPDSGSFYYLPRLVGHQKALELFTLGEKITAKQAFDMGLLTKLTSSDAFLEETTAFAEKLAQLPTEAFGLIKRALKQSWDSSLDEVLELEAQAQRIASQTADHQEGVAAFLEKRKPVFKGK